MDDTPSTAISVTLKMTCRFVSLSKRRSTLSGAVYWYDLLTEALTEGFEAPVNCGVVP